MKNHIKEMRIKKGFTQEQLARILNIQLRRLQYYESGKHEMPVSIALQIAKILNVTVEQLFN